MLEELEPLLFRLSEFLLYMKNYTKGSIITLVEEMGTFETDLVLQKVNTIHYYTSRTKPRKGRQKQDRG